MPAHLLNQAPITVALCRLAPSYTKHIHTVSSAHRSPKHRIHSEPFAHAPITLAQSINALRKLASSQPRNLALSHPRTEHPSTEHRCDVLSAHPCTEHLRTISRKHRTPLHRAPSRHLACASSSPLDQPNSLATSYHCNKLPRIIVKLAHRTHCHQATLHRAPSQHLYCAPSHRSTKHYHTPLPAHRPS